MNAIGPLSLALTVATTGVLVAVAAAVWRSRSTPGGGAFLALVGSVGFWVFCSGFEQAVTDLGLQLRLAQLAWIGIAAVPLASLAVALHATGRGHVVRASLLGLLAAPSVAVVLLALTNEHHQLVWRSIEPRSDSPYPDLVFRHGPAFWASVVYHYGLVALAGLLLARKYAREWPRNRQEALLVGVALVTPWLANARFLLGESRGGALDLTPFAFSVTAVCLSLALWRSNGLLSVIRIARSQILDEMSDGALVVDAHDRLIYANRAARAALDIDPVASPVPAERALAAHPDLLHALASDPGDQREREISIHHRAGGWRIHDVRVTPLENFQGVGTSRVLVLRDVTESRRAQSALRDSEVLLRKVIDLVPHMIFAKDRQGRYLLVNRTMADSAGLPAHEMIGHVHPAMTEAEGRNPQFERMRSEDRRVIETGRPRFHREIQWRYRGGDPRTYQVSKIPFVDPGTGEPSMLGIAIDVTERKRSEEQMRSLALHDSLTGLPNRQHFRERLEQDLGASDRRHRRAALLFLDIDRFKEVNDRHGHALGDLLLRTVAERVGDCLRDSDQIVPPNDEDRTSTVSRLGGDEFTILLSGIRDPLDAAVVATRILAAVGERVDVEGQEIFPSVSIGIAVYPDDTADPDELFRRADQAMYAAKRRGRSRYAFFSPSMTEASELRRAIEETLPHAINRGELEIHYQPARHAKSGLLVGAEALIRWNHPMLGRVPPVEFLAIAEETGLIAGVEEWVFGTVCEQLRLWRIGGLSPVPISINLSGFQLRQPGLLSFVRNMLADSGTSPALIELEVTESALMSDDARVLSALRELREMGVGFALDDFGTGYSSLGYLRRFPFDAVKIDRSFVQDLVADPGWEVLTRGVIDMAHGLGLRVVAEGVERFAELEGLRDAGCDVVQGHLISPPLPVAEFTRYLAREKGELDDDSTWPR